MATAPQHPLPGPSSPININNVQGDILAGLKKNFESFVFFQVKDATKFKHSLAKFIPHITTTKQALAQRDQINDFREKRASGQLHTDPALGGDELQIKLVPTPGINLAFSAKGIHKLGVNGDLKDGIFAAGQVQDANSIGDPGHGTPFVPDWTATFKQEIHGVFVVTAESQDTLNKQFNLVKQSFTDSIHIIDTITGNVRPGPQRGHEHFGFNDGLSQPSIKGFGAPPPSKLHAIDPGVILLGLEGDPHLAERPNWAKEGSFMAFRQLKQLVPEWNTFVVKNALPDISKAHGAALLATRMVGRWQSGASADIAPFIDRPDHATDNNFDYKDDTLGLKCPLGSHVRKMYPRDLDPKAVDPHRVMRAGIPYGPELSPDENDGQTKHERGLLFVCYQSALDAGFHFLQKFWANNVKFPTAPAARPSFTPGFDPVIGINQNQARSMDGIFPFNQDKDLPLPINFVVPQGGEYFFSPSISALRDTFAK